jgi:hypothetical protein
MPNGNMYRIIESKINKNRKTHQELQASIWDERCTLKKIKWRISSLEENGKHWCAEKVMA